MTILSAAEAAPHPAIARPWSRDPTLPLAWDLISYLIATLGLLFVGSTLAVVLHHPFVGFISLTMPAYTQVVDRATGELLPFGQALVGMWQGFEDHRFVLPGLIYYLNQLLLGPVNLLPSLVAILARLVLAGWFLRRIWGFVPDSPFSWRVLAGMVAVLTFQTVDADVYYTADLGWIPLVTCLSLLALDQFARTDPPAAWPPVSAVLLLGLAMVSGAPGLFLWPIVLTLAVIRRSRPAQGAIVLALALVTYGLYFFGFTSEAGGGPGYEAGNLGVLLTSYPLHFLSWIGRYAGLPFGNALFFRPLSTLSVPVSVVTGLGAIAVAGGFALWAVLTGRCRDGVGRWLIGVALFSALWAAATAIKHGAPFGVIGSEHGGPLLHSRFYFGQVWLFAAVLVLGWQALPTSPRARRWFSLAVLGAVLLMGPVQLVGTLNGLR